MRAGRRPSLPAPGSPLPAPGWQLTLRPPPRSARPPGRSCSSPAAHTPPGTVATSPPPTPCLSSRRRWLTPSERSPPNVTNQPPKRSSGSLATGAACPPATDGVGSLTAQLEMTTTRWFCLLTPATQTALSLGAAAHPGVQDHGSETGDVPRQTQCDSTGEAAAEGGNVKGQAKVAQTGSH